MVQEDVRRIALIVIAIFAAHSLSLAVTEPVAQVVRYEKKRKAAVGRLADGSRSRLRPPKITVASTPDDPSLVAYEGLGSWIDLYNRGPWRNPSWTVRRMAHRGVRTIYLQTSTYGSPSHVVFPRKVAEFIASAHNRDMYVVGWTVPSFTQPRKDLRRAKAGLLFETGAGERFDSFALDIEADLVDRIDKRNRRMLELSSALRRIAGSDYPVGAIIPDPGHNLYWPDFPYQRVGSLYDVMVPMGYFTFRTHGYKNVRNSTRKNIRVIRKEAGGDTPIHVIGGIADDVGVPAARGFIRAIKDHDVLGASLYDFPITSEQTWKELSSVPGPSRKGR